MPNRDLPRCTKQQIGAIVFWKKRTFGSNSNQFKSNVEEVIVVFFAVAFATSPCVGDDPTLISYKQHLLRNHLHECIEKRMMTAFLKTSRQRKPSQPWAVMQSNSNQFKSNVEEVIVVFFAVAFATSPCVGDDPTLISYKQHLLRNHLHECIEKRMMTAFPKTSRQRKPSQPWAVMQCSVYFSCRLPECGRMIQCDGCTYWYHEECINAPASAWMDSNCPWYCCTCSKYCYGKLIAIIRAYIIIRISLDPCRRNDVTIFTFIINSQTLAKQERSSKCAW